MSKRVYKQREIPEFERTFTYSNAIHAAEVRAQELVEALDKTLPDSEWDAAVNTIRNECQATKAAAMDAYRAASAGTWFEHELGALTNFVQQA